MHKNVQRFIFTSINLVPKCNHFEFYISSSDRVDCSPTVAWILSRHEIPHNIRVLRSYLVAPFSAMSRGVSWSSIIPVILKSVNYLEHFPFASINMEPQHKMVVNVSIPFSDFSSYVPNNLSPCQVLIRTVLLACVVRQHNGRKEWMPAAFFLCRLSPESVPIPALVVVVLLLL
ncbi:hypothetical protein T08_5206 [Trichinella sp. T8]|nr:hypothetical protein T08_5206 [Trichinella sp. T8]